MFFVEFYVVSVLEKALRSQLFKPEKSAILRITMAAAIPLFSSLFGEPAAWDNPDPNYNVLTASFGHRTPFATAPLCKAGIVQLTA
jgi:hypothetical protein